MSNNSVILVRDVMKKDFDVVDGMALVIDALKTMKHVETKCLIVNKRHENDEYGILLLSDIARKVLAKDLSPRRVNVYEVMAIHVMTINPDMYIRYCARLFDRFELSLAPVLENNTVIGIVSFTDMVLNGFCKNFDDIA